MNTNLEVTDLCKVGSLPNSGTETLYGLISLMMLILKNKDNIYVIYHAPCDGRPVTETNAHGTEQRL